MSLHQRPIIVVGMQRSGTSALSGALAKLGVFFGADELLYQGDDNNPQGYFEHRKATILNLRALHTFQLHPTSVRPFPEHWADSPSAEPLRESLRAFLREDFDGKGRWGIKQPVTSLVLPLYKAVFAELAIRPHYLLCVRNPLEAMASEARLDFGGSYRVMPSLGERAIGSWLRYTLGALSQVEGDPVTVVPYETLLATPRTVLQKVVARDPEWRPNEGDWEVSLASIRTDLRHNARSLDELDRYPSLVRRTFETVTSFDDTNPEKWAEVRALASEFNAWTAMMDVPAPMHGKLGLSWRVDGNPRVAETQYEPSGTWQTVSIEIDAPPKTFVGGLLYAHPFRAWIRRAVWRVGDRETAATVQAGLASSLVREGAFLRLNGVFEPNQIHFTTPGGPGPYVLQLEFLLETGPMIGEEAAADLGRKLDACVQLVDNHPRSTKR